MRKPRGRIAGAAMAAAGMLVATPALVLSTPGVAHAAAYDFQWPETNGCDDSAITARVATVPTGKVELRYSTRCRTVWSRVTVYKSALIKEPSGWVVRNSDRYSTAGMVRLYSDSAGNLVVYSRMLNDAGVTSYAVGDWGSVDGHHTVRTGSY